MRQHRRIPQEQQDEVRGRANFLCEYCHASERWQYVPFTVDHVVPLNKGGTDTLDNLALACFHCNRQKSDNVTASDPVTEAEVALFNPRLDEWNAHFIWSTDGLMIVGVTPVGRATIERLQLNRQRVIHIRTADSDVGRHPPNGDKVQR